MKQPQAVQYTWYWSPQSGGERRKDRKKSWKSGQKNFKSDEKYKSKDPRN